jgi:hypothetical protein
MPSETDGKVVVSKGLEVSEPGVDAAYDIDMGIEPNKFPKDSGSDTYQGIPGDGIVPG